MLTIGSGIRRLSRQAAIGMAVLVLGVAARGHAAVDPPGFAPVPVEGGQIVRLNVVCFDHEVSEWPPNPCNGVVMLHDAAGRELKRAAYALAPGQAMNLQLAIPALTAAGTPVGRVAIVPCVIPAPGGRAVPSVEVFDRDAGRVVLFAHPATARMSEFDNGGEPSRTAELGLRSDPPGFGVATLRADQRMRMNVACFEHAVDDAAPATCRGTVMFHDAAGNVLRRGVYELEPGRSASFGVAPPPARSPGTLAGIIPCIIPDPGGRAVPNVEVVDSAGKAVLLINPAVARMSQFQVQEPVAAQ